MENWNDFDPKAAASKNSCDAAVGAAALERPEELCSTAVPSPALTASGGSCGGVWSPQDFEAFGLAEEEELFLSEAAAAFAGASAVPCATGAVEDGYLELPPGLVPDEVAGAELDLSQQPLLASVAHFLPEEALWDAGFLGGFVPEMMQEETALFFSFPGHAETGEWAQRIAPRPCMELDELAPLVVRLGGAPDGFASLEVAQGLEGFDETKEEDVQKLDDVRKCEVLRPATDAELHSPFGCWQAWEAATMCGDGSGASLVA